MKKKSKNPTLFLSLFLLFVISIFNANAQSMYYTPKTGTVVGYNLSDVRYMTFTGGAFNVLKTNNATNSYLFPNFRKIHFASGLTTGTNNHQILSELNVYPNPFHEKIYINVKDKIEVGANFKILSLEGKVLMTKAIENSGLISVDMSHLPNAVYFCMYSNGNEFKTIKIFKQ